MALYLFNIVYAGAVSEDVPLDFPSVEAARSRAEEFAEILGAKVLPKDRAWKIVVTNLHGDPAFEAPLRQAAALEPAC